MILGFFDKLNEKYGFTLDVCATNENAKCKEYFTLKDDGLSKNWAGIIWMNPPYGREIGKWMKKAYESAKQGAIVVCLVPARTVWLTYDSPAKRSRIVGHIIPMSPAPRVMMMSPGCAAPTKCCGTADHDGSNTTQSGGNGTLPAIVLPEAPGMGVSPGANTSRTTAKSASPSA